MQHREITKSYEMLLRGEGRYRLRRGGEVESREVVVMKRNDNGSGSRMNGMSQATLSQPVRRQSRNSLTQTY